jgi:hypothetical protein
MLDSRDPTGRRELMLDAGCWMLNARPRTSADYSIAISAIVTPVAVARISQL